MATRRSSSPRNLVPTTASGRAASGERQRRAFGQYFYALTGYKGRVHSTFEGDVEDNAYFEFGGARDDSAAFTAQGSLKMELRGQEEIPNSGGKQLTVLHSGLIGQPDLAAIFRQHTQAEFVEVSVEVRNSASRPAWECSTPLGSDVVPEV